MSITSYIETLPSVTVSEPMRRLQAVAAVFPHSILLFLLPPCPASAWVFYPGRADILDRFSWTLPIDVQVHRFVLAVLVREPRLSLNAAGGRTRRGSATASLSRSTLSCAPTCCQPSRRNPRRAWQGGSLPLGSPSSTVRRCWSSRSSAGGGGVVVVVQE